MCLVLCRWRKANWRDLWREETWKYGEARLPSSKLHFALSPDLSRRILTLSESSDWAVDDKKKIESVTIRITWWFQSILPVRTLTFWQQSSLRKQMVVYLSYYIWSFLRVCEYSVFNLRLIVMITRSQNYWPVSVSFVSSPVRYSKFESIRYFIDIDILQNCLIDIDIDIDIFQNHHIDIDIDIDIFGITLSISISISIFFRIALSISISISIFSKMTISISISISIFFKSVDISTIDMSYRYIEQG